MRKNDNKSSDKIMTMYIFGYPRAPLQKINLEHPVGMLCLYGWNNSSNPLFNPTKSWDFNSPLKA